MEKQPRRMRSDSVAQRVHLASVSYANLPHPREIEDLNDRELDAYYAALQALPPAMISTVTMSMAVDLAVTTVKIEDLRVDMKDAPAFYTTDTGQVKPHPAYTVYSQLCSTKLQIVTKLGLHSRDRSQYIQSASTAQAKPTAVASVKANPKLSENLIALKRKQEGKE